MDIINTVALAPLSQTATVAAPAAAAAPNAAAAARFAELMALPPDATTAANAVQASGVATLQQANALPPIDANSSVGDRILNGINNLTTDMKSSWDSVSKAVTANSGDAVNMQDLLKLQLHLVQTSFQYEMVGKVISRSTTNLDQLVRIQ